MPALLAAGALAGPAHTRTFTVGATTDQGDQFPGDGICRTSDSECTLRAAVEEANAFTGDPSDTIKRGRVRLQTARTRGGSRQSGQFFSGLFQVLQSRSRSARGLTELRLKGSSFASCKTAKGRRAGVHASASRRVRRLGANARGRFRTRGRHSAATVRGTRWTTTDRCDGTLTTVQRGKVAVRDFRRKKTIAVRAGKSYLARGRR